MGLQVERRTAEGWRPANLDQIHRDPWGKVLSVPCFYDFNDFWLLYVLSGDALRGDPDDMPPPIVPKRRGEPPDLSRELRRVAEDDSAYYISWLTARELLEYDWDAYAKHLCGITGYSAPKPTALLDAIAKLQPLDDHRVIIELW